VNALAPADGLILAVAHRCYRDGGWPLIAKLVKERGVVMDVKGLLPREAKPSGLTLWRL
jgi:UDP-N-acetyl-D-galactosamine dehydrogenase